VFVDAAAVEAAQARAEASRSVVPEATEEEDKEMAAFQSMLQEYLSRMSPVSCRMRTDDQWRNHHYQSLLLNQTLLHHRETWKMDTYMICTTGMQGLHLLAWV